MKSYYPYGKPIHATKKQIEHHNYIFELFKYYGIPFGEFNDYLGEGRETYKEHCYTVARDYIIRHQPLPNYLVSRLLKFKEDN